MKRSVLVIVVMVCVGVMETQAGAVCKSATVMSAQTSGTFSAVKEQTSARLSLQVAVDGPATVQITTVTNLGNGAEILGKASAEELSEKGEMIEGRKPKPVLNEADDEEGEDDEDEEKEEGEGWDRVWDAPKLA